MENAMDALKIAAGALMFVLALTISISCFSKANESVTAIVNMRDRDTKIIYDNIKPSNGLTRTVGIETIVPAMYKTYDENIEIYFKDSSGNSIPIYYKTAGNGKREVDDDGNYIIVNYVNLAAEVYPDKETCIKHLDMILSVGQNNKASYEHGSDVDMQNMIKKYKEQFHENYPYGFLEFIKNKKFEEKLGEYYESEGSTATQIKKRIITYQEKTDL